MRRVQGLRGHGGPALVLVLAASVFAFHAAPASAQSRASDAAEVVRRADEARVAGQFAEARDLYLEAHQLAPEAIHLLKAAAASYEMGQYTATLDLVARALAETNAPLDPARIAFAHDLEGRARALTTRLKLSIEPRDVPVTVLVDLRIVDVVDGVALVDHGEHTITIRATGYETFEAVMELREPDQDLVVPLTPLGPRASPAAPGGGIIVDAPPEPAPRRRRTGLIVGVTVAVVLVAAVAIAVPLALRDDDDSGPTGPNGSLSIVRF
ncbi:MAG: hypothetical protein AAF447_14305 [Myxococcota bacterium]